MRILSGFHLWNWSDSDSGEQVEKIIETKDVDIPAEGGQLRVDFSHTPKTPGEILLHGAC